MADFIDKLEEKFRILNTKVARFTKNREIIAETKAISDLVRAQSLKLKNDAKKLPSKAVTDLHLSEIPQIFSLKRVDPSDNELSPSEGEMVSLPRYLELVLADYDLATGGSPPNEALLRSRIDVIMLSTLAKMKYESKANPRLSIGSALSTDTIKSLHLQFERSIKRPWKVKGERVLLSGVVDYFLWFGKPDDYETNLVMVEAKKPEFLKGGMLQCLAYMGMIHNARKMSKMYDTSVYGVATDSFEWQFIHIRESGEFAIRSYHWDTSKSKIVSLLYMIFETAAGSSAGSQRKRWRQGSDIDFTTELEKRPKVSRG
ncbi:hypothetical protein N7491_000112 [Penicillium cf. griseofulvum]|uniref:Uncharacterized protein n=1 Tax=Penicillium cf. griseofulvum TaxID=2972120 RepID=A0A9W9JNT8_9EURO|nr:hypothetical protein N7472_004536 [Penicillium cf. griseofulvum]KAJ5442098.1 hypothetical protein N7445_005105 [Penicillium cf. griseofulvum]KAJ5450930.1 hypothetical protein N7491_000112 [Penicillium cf. griseofulvum]